MAFQNLKGIFYGSPIGISIIRKKGWTFLFDLEASKG